MTKESENTQEPIKVDTTVKPNTRVKPKAIYLMIFNKSKGVSPCFYIKMLLKSILVIVSVVFVVILGTLSHEFGHYIMAKHLGYESSLNYAHTIYVDKHNVEFVKYSFDKYQNYINKGLSFPNSDKYYFLKNKYFRDGFLITLNGILTTIVISIIGLNIAVYSDKNDKRNITYLGAFFCLFILRQPCNFFIGLLNSLILDKPNHSDEIKLASALHIPSLSLEFITSLLAIFMYHRLMNLKVFKNIKVFVSFHILFGGITGYYLWLYKFGHVLLP
ncbi:hypothetical protein AEM51_06370 [Bacteroidetes bacterium UKL13-3]|nr:hypothetical protein AEM51_06370 [Bacteroidetes bacterium UKL13-3]